MYNADALLRESILTVTKTKYTPWDVFTGRGPIATMMRKLDPIFKYMLAGYSQHNVVVYDKSPTLNVEGEFVNFLKYLIEMFTKDVETRVLRNTNLGTIHLESDGLYLCDDKVAMKLSGLLDLDVSFLFIYRDNQITLAYHHPEEQETVEFTISYADGNVVFPELFFIFNDLIKCVDDAYSNLTALANKASVRADFVLDDVLLNGASELRTVVYKLDDQSRLSKIPKQFTLGSFSCDRRFVSRENVIVPAFSIESFYDVDSTPKSRVIMVMDLVLKKDNEFEFNTIFYITDTQQSGSSKPEMLMVDPKALPRYIQRGLCKAFNQGIVELVEVISR